MASTSTIIGGEYRVLGKIGEGSFGEVFRATHVASGVDYAVKRELVETPNPQLVHEANIYKALAGGNDDGIANMRWFGREGAYNALVIDLLGPNLKQVCQEHERLPLSFVIELGVQVISILEFIHNRGIVYRDIKPDNFLLGANVEFADPIESGPHTPPAFFDQSRHFFNDTRPRRLRRHSFASNLSASSTTSSTPGSPLTATSSSSSLMFMGPMTSKNVNAGPNSTAPPLIDSISNNVIATHYSGNSSGHHVNSHGRVVASSLDTSLDGGVLGNRGGQGGSVDPTAYKVFLVDFGLAGYYRNAAGKHIPNRGSTKDKVGTARYASINIHCGREHTRRDDIESVGYMLLELLNGSLPWSGISARTSRQGWAKMREIKEEIELDELCEGLPRGFMTFVGYARSLQFSETPDYEHLRSLLRLSAGGYGPEAQTVRCQHYGSNSQYSTSLTSTSSMSRPTPVSPRTGGGYHGGHPGGGQGGRQDMSFGYTTGGYPSRVK